MSGIYQIRLVEAVFRKHKSQYVIGAIYSTATVLWVFLGQLLQDGKTALLRQLMHAFARGDIAVFDRY